MSVLLFINDNALNPYPLLQSARELTGVTLGQEIAAALKIVTGWIENPESDEHAASREEGKVELFGKRMKTVLREVWKDPSGDVFDIGYVSCHQSILAID